MEAKLKVLVTGGSGFIGSHTIDILLENGYTVSNFDIKTPWKSAHNNLWFQGDIVNLEDIYRAINEFEPNYIIHLAAHAEIYSNRWDDFASIHRGTENLLHAIDDYGRLERLLNVSTQLVIEPGYEPRSLLDYRPYTIYGEAKSYAESLLLQWRSSVHWVTVRPTNIWGPGHPSFSRAIWRYLHNRFYLHPMTKLPVFRTYGFVENTSAQIIKLLETDPAETYRQVFYAGDGVIDSSIWVDLFSRALTNKPAHRVPVPILRSMGALGDITARAGFRIPIDSGRVMRMTQSYAVPLERTLLLTGMPEIGIIQGVEKSVKWLIEEEKFKIPS